MFGRKRYLCTRAADALRVEKVSALCEGTFLCIKERIGRLFPLAIGLIVVAGCATPHAAVAVSSAPTSLANGQSIYQTGKDLSGAQIVAQTPPLLRSCAACHRADGSGGVHLSGGAVSADLRHAALVTNQKRPYTMSLLERAISTGIDNTGAPLNTVMPRWKLSKQNLHDVASYVLTTLK